jgi:hypothetical protein
MIIAELYRDGECIARWTDENGPPGLASMLPRLRELGWTIHDYRSADYTGRTRCSTWEAAGDVGVFRRIVGGWCKGGRLGTGEGSGS